MFNKVSVGSLLYAPSPHKIQRKAASNWSSCTVHSLLIHYREKSVHTHIHTHYLTAWMNESDVWWDTGCSRRKSGAQHYSDSSASAVFQSVTSIKTVSLSCSSAFKAKHMLLLWEYVQLSAWVSGAWGRTLIHLHSDQIPRSHSGTWRTPLYRAGDSWRHRGGSYSLGCSFSFLD